MNIASGIIQLPFSGMTLEQREGRPLEFFCSGKVEVGPIGPFIDLFLVTSPTEPGRSKGWLKSAADSWYGELVVSNELMSVLQQAFASGASFALNASFKARGVDVDRGMDVVELSLVLLRTVSDDDA